MNWKWNEAPILSLSEEPREIDLKAGKEVLLDGAGSAAPHFPNVSSMHSWCFCPKGTWIISSMQWF
jgi:hypothetical protein